VTRPEALAAAVALLDDIAPRANSRGYSDGTIKPAERVALVLQVADWFLVDVVTVEAAVKRVTEAFDPSTGTYARVLDAVQ
jgi:hypothetical protein